MKPTKQLFNDMLAWWEESFQDKKFRDTLIWLLGIVVTLGVILALAFPSSAATDPVEPTEPAVPANLTGYTVTLPAGWTASAGYGIFSIEGTFSHPTYGDNEFYSLYVGYALNFDTYDYEPSPGAIVYGGYANTMPNGETLVFTVTGGSDASSMPLINWLVSNNATFVNNNEPPSPEGVTIPAGIYYMQNIENDTRGTITFDTPFSAGDSMNYTSISFVANNNNQNTDVVYTFTPIVPDGTAGPPAPPVSNVIYDGANGFDNIANCIILLREDEILTIEEATLFNEVFIPVNSENKLLNLYVGAHEIGRDLGIDMGYNTGYEEGFTDGVENSGGNFFGNFIEGILNALDKLVILPGEISILDILKAIGGLFVVVWLLKLLAGG